MQYITETISISVKNTDNIKSLVQSAHDDSSVWKIRPQVPILKECIAYYSGAQTGLKDFSPDEIVPVYRSAIELSKPETLSTFNNKAILNDHPNELITSPNGDDTKMRIAVTGNEAEFIQPYLLNSIIPLTHLFQQLLASGKIQLSAGYYCIFVLQSGIFNGVAYKAIQINIKADHIALVKDGRNGPDVAVKDSNTFSIDQLECVMATDVNTDTSQGDEISLKSLMEMLQSISGDVADLKAKLATKADREDIATDPDLDDTDASNNDDSDVMDEKADQDDKKLDKEKSDKSDSDKKTQAMDAQIQALTKTVNYLKNNGAKLFSAEMQQRDQLANQLSTYVGTFDSSNMTAQEVAKYGVEKLNINAISGQEGAALNGYFAAMNQHHQQIRQEAIAMDSSTADDNVLDSFFKKGDK